MKTTKEVDNEEQKVNYKRKLSDSNKLEIYHFKKIRVLSIERNSHISSNLSNIHEKDSFITNLDEPLDLSIKKQDDIHSIQKTNRIIPINCIEPIDLSFKTLNHLNSKNKRYKIPQIDCIDTSNADNEIPIQLHLSHHSNFSNQERLNPILCPITVETNECNVKMPSQYQVLQIKMEKNKYANKNLYQNLATNSTESTYMVDSDSFVSPYQIKNHNSFESTSQDEKFLEISDSTSQDEKFLEISDSDHFKIMNNAKNECFQKQQDETNFQENLHLRENFPKSSISSERRKKFIHKQQLILDNNIDFIEKISDIFTFEKNFSVENDLDTMCSNLKTFLIQQIDITNTTINIDTRRNEKTSACRNINDVSKLLNFCPFCPIQKFNENNCKKIEKKFIADFHMKIKPQLTVLIDYLFQQTSNLFKKPFTIEKLLSSQFYKSQRIILGNILQIFDSNKIIFGQEKRIAYLHTQYHQLFFEDVDMKFFFLPELQSIIYVLLRPSYDNHLINKNRSFMIVLYCFYSLNKLFDWISQFYQQNCKIISKCNSPLSTFIMHTITFILRVSFIEPIFSQLTLNKSAQIKYHFLCLNVFYDELCTFLSEENRYQSIATNSKKLIPYVIFFEINMFKEQFVDYLESNAEQLIQMNANHMHEFLNFLKIINESTIHNNAERLRELEKFFKIECGLLWK